MPALSDTAFPNALVGLTRRAYLYRGQTGPEASTENSVNLLLALEADRGVRPHVFQAL